MRPLPCRAHLGPLSLLLFTDRGRLRACWRWRGALLAWVAVGRA